MNNIEEYIKVLEEFLNYECTKRLISPCEIQAIENLINKVKSQQKQIKLMQSINIPENFIEKSKIDNKISYYEKVLEETSEKDEIDKIVLNHIIYALNEILEESEE